MLVLYLFLWGSMIRRIYKVSSPTRPTQLIWAANLVGGIATGLAVSVLGVTEPSQAPDFTIFSAGFKNTDGAKVLTSIFLLGWVIIGALALIVNISKENPAPTDESLTAIYNSVVNYGIVWLGMAVSGAALYLG